MEGCLNIAKSVHLQNICFHYSNPGNDFSAVLSAIVEGAIKYLLILVQPVQPDARTRRVYK